MKPKVAFLDQEYLENRSRPFIHEIVCGTNFLVGDEDRGMSSFDGVTFIIKVQVYFIGMQRLTYTLKFCTDHRSVQSCCESELGIMSVFSVWRIF